MSFLSYKHPPQNALFELSTQVGIIRNKLCDIKQQLDSLKTTDTSQKTDITSLQETLTNIQTQLNNLTSNITITEDNIDIVGGLNVNATTGINLFQNPHTYKITADADGLWFQNVNNSQSKSLLGFGVQMKFPTGDDNCIIIQRGKDEEHIGANIIKIPFGTEITSAGAIVMHT
jgi:hypothetical protein